MVRLPMSNVGVDVEEGGEHPTRHREAFVVHGVVSVARKKFAQLRFAREEQRIDALREVATALAGKLEARLDRVGDAHSPRAVRHATE